jgi:hypothetical protein
MSIVGNLVEYLESALASAAAKIPTFTFRPEPRRVTTEQLQQLVKVLLRRLAVDDVVVRVSATRCEREIVIVWPSGLLSVIAVPDRMLECAPTYTGAKELVHYLVEKIEAIP